MTKPKGLLAEFASTRKAPTVLLGDIQDHAIKRAQEENRRQDIIHPSEMAKADWCPRATAYRVSGTAPTDSGEVHGARMLTIFQEGHDIHSKYQTWLGQMRRLYGLWRCSICYKARWGTGTLLCTTCHNTPMEYREVPLDAEASHMIAGHADGAVLDVQAMIEVKSIGLGTVRMEEPSLVSQYTVKAQGSGKSVVDFDGLWNGIKRPLLSHRKQAGIYLFIMREVLGHDVDKMIFIYENKANQDVKEFVIRYDAELIEPLLDTAKDIKWAVEKGTTLPRPPEFTKEKKPCTKCPWRTLCWDGDDQDSAAQRDAADGDGLARSQAPVGAAEDQVPEATGGRLPRTAGRSHRTGRQQPDAPVRADDEVGRVPGRAGGDGRGRRTVRRRRTGTGAGSQGL